MIPKCLAYRENILRLDEKVAKQSRANDKGSGVQGRTSNAGAALPFIQRERLKVSLQECEDDDESMNLVHLECMFY